MHKLLSERNKNFHYS